MRFWHSNIRAALRRIFDRAFPERQIFLRSKGEVRFVRLSPPLQAVTAAALTLAIGWGLYASVRLIAGDERLAARRAELRFVSTQLDMLAREVTRLQREALARTRKLEAQQTVLKTAVGLDEEEGGKAADAPDADAAPETPPAVRHGESPTPATARESLLLREGEGIGKIREGTDRLLARLDRLAGQQRRLANRILEREQTRIEEARRLFARLDVSPTAMRQGSDRRVDAQVPPASGVGGPFAPITPISPVHFGVSDLTGAPEGDDAAQKLLQTRLAVPFDLPVEPEFRKLAQTLVLRQRISSLLESLPRTKPVRHYYISSGFGPRRDPFRKRRSMHYGLDMAGWPGEPIHAVAPGVVIKAGRAPAYGLMVEIDHGNGYHTRYGHMSRLFVRKGETVTPGTRIGNMGSTGRSTSTHLHWEVWYHGRPVNPLPYLKAIADVETFRKEFERKSDGQG